MNVLGDRPHICDHLDLEFWKKVGFMEYMKTLFYREQLGIFPSFGAQARVGLGLRAESLEHQTRWPLLAAPKENPQRERQR